MLALLVLSVTDVAFRFAPVLLVAAWVGGFAFACLMKPCVLRGLEQPIGASPDASGIALAAVEAASATIGEKAGEIAGDIGRVQVLLSEAIAQLMASFREIEAHLAMSEAGSDKVPEVISSQGTEVAPASPPFKSLANPVAQAVVAMQFQDMVSQLLEHVVAQVSRIAEIAAAENEFARRLHEAPREEWEALLQEQIGRIHAATQNAGPLSKKLDDNPVSQTGIRSGEVELF
jgi:hypothetical protein